MIKRISLPCVDRLRDLLKYDPLSGVFLWKIRPARRMIVGSVAGGINAHGYTQIRIDGVQLYAQRLAWLHFYGIPPIGDIDHINGDRSDNRIDNLRDVSRSINNQNQRVARKENKSGFLGVHWKKEISKWVAQITVDGKKVYLGCFNDPKSAHDCYLEAKRKYHEGCTI